MSVIFELVIGLLHFDMKRETQARRTFEDRQKIGFLTTASETPADLGKMRSPPVFGSPAALRMHLAMQEPLETDPTAFLDDLRANAWHVLQSIE